MSWWGSSPIDELVEKATSELLPSGQENIALNLDISDQIRSKKINAKEAMRSIKKRLGHKNPNVQLATLSLADTCVKNGGELFVREIATREFMDELVSILKSPTGCNVDVKNKLLTVIQTWGLASKNKPVINYMYDTYVLLKAEGTQFPPVNERNVDGILLETAAAPEWSDSDVCDRCRTPFTLTNRKHHCRNCGGTFCQQCSSKTMPLPHLGINEYVRVCDGCHIKLKLDKAAITASTSTSSVKKSIPVAAPEPSQTDDFDDDMKKAIELSLKEAEQQKNSFGAGYVAPTQTYTAPPAQAQESVEDDPDLAAAIAASLRDLEISKQHHESAAVQQVRKNDLSPVEMENILLFSTLMDRIYATGGDASNDSQITQLYTQIGALQPKLIKNLDETIQKRNAFIQLSEKLNAAVRAYDRLLEDRINNVRQHTQDNYYNIPEQHYQQQPQYYQQDTNKYYPEYSQTQDVNPYYTAPPATTTTSYQPSQATYQASYSTQSQATSYPPQQTTTTATTYPPAAQNQAMYPPQNTVEQKQQPVDETPLIDLE